MGHQKRGCTGYLSERYVWCRVSAFKKKEMGVVVSGDPFMFVTFETF